jgi:hypothetical protein
MQEEIWKDIPGYENYYQVSNQGNVRSLDRKVGNRLLKGKVLNTHISKGYYRLQLNYNSKARMMFVHQLVAMAFLGHKPDGTTKIVVDHIDNNPLNNNLTNLQVISGRENSSKDRKGSSKYTGVHWNKQKNKWTSSIEVKNKLKHLGYFDLEEEASKYYQDALKSIEEGTEIKVKRPKLSSKYKGVSFNKNRNKWESYIQINNKKKNLGLFKCELAAAAAYQKELIKLNK